MGTIKLNKKNIDSLFSKTMKMTKNDMLTFIDDNWTDNPYLIHVGSEGIIMHSPSQPGQFPAIQSGDLKRSISGTSNKDNIIISSSEEYAVYLELGTKKMEPRPFFNPTLNRTFKFFVNNMRRNLK